jgi:diguanylate cyclase (GGDEF)-like protein
MVRMRSSAGLFGHPMQIDLQTLLTVTVVATAIAGLLLLFSWTQFRNTPALALWGGGFILGTIAAALIIARGQVPDFWSIEIGNAVLALAYGTMWAGVRSFEGRSIPLPILCAGAVLWLLACQSESFYGSAESRVVLRALIVGAYLLLSAWELSRSRDQGLYSRWPVIIVLVVHAAVFFGRTSLVGTWAATPESLTPRSDWILLLAFEGLFFTFCVAYLLGSMAQERVAQRHKNEAHADPLTGVANRRAFFSHGEAIVKRTKIARQSVSLLLFDLDSFKSINDTHGHLAGDRMLREFCHLASQVLRPGDLFGRVGGEEFACVLASTGVKEAERIAERIRRSFASSQLVLEGVPIQGTVSIGIASLHDGSQTLSGLILAADQALYRAKAGGRNRIEVSGLSNGRDRRNAAAG